MVRAEQILPLGYNLAALVALFVGMGTATARPALLPFLRQMLKKFGGGITIVPGKLLARNIVLVCQAPLFFGDGHRVLGIPVGKLNCFFVKVGLITPPWISMVCFLWYVKALKTGDNRRQRHSECTLPNLDLPLSNGRFTTSVREWAEHWAPIYFNGTSLDDLTLAQLKRWGHDVVLSRNGPWVDERITSTAQDVVQGILPPTLEGVMSKERAHAFSVHQAYGDVGPRGNAHRATSHSVDRFAEAVYLRLFFRALFKGETIDNVANYNEALLDYFIDMTDDEEKTAGLQAQTFKVTLPQLRLGEGPDLRNDPRSSRIKVAREADPNITLAKAYMDAYPPFDLDEFMADAYAESTAAQARFEAAERDA